MPRILAWLLVVAALAGSEPSFPAEGEPGWRMLNETAELGVFLADQRAAAQPALVVFTIRGCPPCRAVWQQIARLPLDLQRRVVGARIEDLPELAEAYAVPAVPWLIAFAGDGRSRVLLDVLDDAELGAVLTHGPPAEIAPNGP
jgi:hypothetical protein